MSKDIELYNAIKRAVDATFKEVGLAAFKKTSLFMSNKTK